MTAPDHSSPVRSLGLLVIGAVLGGMAGFLYAASAGITLDGHDHATDHDQHGGQHAGQHGGQHGGHDHDDMVEIGSNNAHIQPGTGTQFQASIRGGDPRLHLCAGCWPTIAPRRSWSSL